MVVGIAAKRAPAIGALLGDVVPLDPHPLDPEIVSGVVLQSERLEERLQSGLDRVDRPLVLRRTVNLQPNGVQEVGEVRAGDILDLRPVEVLRQQAKVPSVRRDRVLAGTLADQATLESIDCFAELHCCLLLFCDCACPLP